MSQEFNTLQLYIKEMKRRYFFALSAFYSYEALLEITASNLVGQDVAEKNVEIINTFKDFFLPAKEALRVYFFLELAKLFDESDQSLHISKILNYTQSNILKLTVSDFEEFSQGRDFLTNLVENFNGIKNSDLKEIKKEIEKSRFIIQKVKDYRDQYLAHDDLKKVEIIITGEEAVLLFNLLEKILNLFSKKLASEETLYDQIENRAKDQTKMMIDYLKRFEPYRIKEIYEQSDREIQELIKRHG